MKLFAIYIGGQHPRANIEVHDIRFVVAPTIRDTYEKLRTDWWGTPSTLHVDCWAEIDHVDGFDVQLKPAPSTTREKLYFVNLGGYDGQDFAEQHKNMFVVARSAADAKVRGLQSISGWNDPHRDDLYEAETVYALDEMIGERLHIHLSPSDSGNPPRFSCKFMPIKQVL
jgi:hypothetical protein